MNPKTVRLGIVVDVAIILIGRQVIGSLNKTTTDSDVENGTNVFPRLFYNGQPVKYPHEKT